MQTSPEVVMADEKEFLAVSVPPSKNPRSKNLAVFVIVHTALARNLGAIEEFPRGRSRVGLYCMRFPYKFQSLCVYRATFRDNGSLLARAIQPSRVNAGIKLIVHTILW